MANVVVVSSQWGDEGKGKIIDWLSEHADILVRFQGGHNAGRPYFAIRDTAAEWRDRPQGGAKRNDIGMTREAERKAWFRILQPRRSNLSRFAPAGT